MMIFLYLLYFINLVYSQCNNIVTRRDIRGLSSGELSAFINAIRELQSGPAPTRYDEFARIHLDNAPSAHGTRQFMVWHREYILQFEELLKSINPSITLPYWDWSADSDNPSGSYVLQSNLFGGNGNPNNNNCVEEGAFANLMVQYPAQHCLKRQYDQGPSMSNFFSTNSVLQIIRSSESYETMNNDIEMLPHARVHVNLGGNEGDMSYMFSTNDPLFWLHHAFIDKIYWEWQQQHPDLAYSYPGNVNEDLSGLNNSVSNVLNTIAGNRYCYTYNRFPGASMGNSLSVDIEEKMDALNNLNNLAKLDNSKVKPLPDTWIARNGLDPRKVRAREHALGIGNP